MILFGYRAFVKTLAVLTFMCSRCGNPAAQRVEQRSRWFTLFFIPVIPLGVTRFTTCTYCGVTQKVSKDQADQMVAAVAGAPPVGPAPQTFDPGQAAPSQTWRQ